MPSYYAPNLLTQSIQSDGVLDLVPGDGYHTRIKGGAIGSLWADTRSTGALSSDYSQFRLTRAGVAKWRTGNNLDGSGNDHYTIYRDADGTVTDLEVMKITRSSARVDFSGAVYSGGVLLTGGLANPLVPGSDTTSAFTIRNAANTADFIRTYGNGRLKLGLTTLITPREGYSIELYSRTSFSAFGDAAILMVSNQGGQNTGWSSSAHVGVCGMSSDGGMRLAQNAYNRASDGAFVNYEGGRPQSIIGMDSAGTFSYSYAQPSALGTGTYSGTVSQTFVISGAGYTSAAFEETQNVDLMTMQGGRYMRFRTCAVFDAANPTITGSNKPQPVIEFHSDQTIWWYKKMTSPVCAAAMAPFCFRPGVAPTTPIDGDEWATTAGRFCRVNGVTKTYTLT